MKPSPVTELHLLLRDLRPVLSNEPFIFCTAPRRVVPKDLVWKALIQEDEGLTIVATEQAAIDANLPLGHRWANITLSIHSDLHAVGLTAAVSTALSDQGISCNVVAAAHHDHLFVPWETRQATLVILTSLQAK